MRTNGRTYHFGLTKTAVFKTAVLVLVAMIFNIFNLAAFAAAYTLDFNSSALKSETKRGRVCSNVNAPIKLFDDLFNSGKFSDAKASQKHNGGNPAVLPQKVKKAEQTYFKPAASFGQIPSSMKVLQNFSENMNLQLNYVLERLYCSDGIRFLLLAMILFCLLPRGIPVNRRSSFKNIILHSPAF